MTVIAPSAENTRSSKPERPGQVGARKVNPFDPSNGSRTPLPEAFDMRITLKLAMQVRCLPPEASEHSVALEVDENTTANQVIERFHIPREAAHLVLLNGVYLPPEARERPAFKAGDTLVLWPPVAGG